MQCKGRGSRTIDNIVVEKVEWEGRKVDVYKRPWNETLTRMTPLCKGRVAFHLSSVERGYGWLKQFII